MARPVSTFLAQQLWWLGGIGEDRLGFQRRGLWTKLRARRHRELRRPIHVNFLTADRRLANFVDLHLFWLNERCATTRFSIDGDPREADVMWVFAQDPLSDETRKRIDAARAAAPRAKIVNDPGVHDFYHAADAFDRLARAGVPVPRAAFGPGDEETPVFWKPVGRHSQTIGPEPYRGPRPGFQPFEAIDARDRNGLSWRYRVFYLFGAVYLAQAYGAAEPVVRLANRTAEKSDWQLSLGERRQVEAIAGVSGLDVFATDFVRRHGDGEAVFTDINVFPVFKTAAPGPRHYGYWHDFDIVRTMPGSPEAELSAWQWIDRFAAGEIPRP